MIDKDNVAIVKRKKARGTVLGLLDESYPTGVAYAVMERVLNATGKCQSHELPGIVKYLQDKQYVNVLALEEPELKPLLSSVIELTAHGVDLLEGSLPEDPGIIV